MKSFIAAVFHGSLLMLKKLVRMCPVNGVEKASKLSRNISR